MKKDHGFIRVSWDASEPAPTHANGFRISIQLNEEGCLSVDCAPREDNIDMVVNHVKNLLTVELHRLLEFSKRGRIPQ